MYDSVDIMLYESASRLTHLPEELQSLLAGSQKTVSAAALFSAITAVLHYKARAYGKRPLTLIQSHPLFVTTPTNVVAMDCRL